MGNGLKILKYVIKQIITLTMIILLNPLIINSYQLQLKSYKMSHSQQKISNLNTS